jgi:5-enolpyruvylshikimate-3-phosphate synthase
MTFKLTYNTVTSNGGVVNAAAGTTITFKIIVKPVKEIVKLCNGLSPMKITVATDVANATYTLGATAIDFAPSFTNVACEDSNANDASDLMQITNIPIQPL